MLFLSRFSYRTRVLHQDPVQFIQKLSRRWESTHPPGQPVAPAAEQDDIHLDDPRDAVFISYAHEDAEAARAMAEALRQQGIPVWFDKGWLRLGDAWDLKIERAIEQCAFFLPLVSQNTEAQLEAYFRREWNLAEDRSKKFYEETPFILPALIDDLDIEQAHVRRCLDQGRLFTYRAVSLMKPFSTEWSSSCDNTK